MLSAGMQRAVLLVLGYLSFKASHVALVVKNLPPSAGNVRDMSSVPGSGRSPGGAYTNPLQYSCLENPMDRGAWQATQLKQLSIHLCTRALTRHSLEHIEASSLILDPLDSERDGKSVSRN